MQTLQTIHNGPASDADRWYVVEAQDGAVQRARLSLALGGLHVWAPVDVKRMPRARNGQKRNDLKIPRFGRYFFVRCHMTDAVQDAIKQTLGVRDLLKGCGSDSPAVVSQAQIDWLRANKVEADAAASAAPYVTGDTIKVVGEGHPFTGFHGVIKSVDKHSVICLELDLFGRLTPVLIEARHVEMTQPAKSRVISSLKRRHRDSGADGSHADF